MEIISNTALISINETLIIQVISFLIFLFIMNRIMFRPLQKTMGDRDQYLETIAQDIDDAKKDVERYTLEIEDRKSIIRSEAYKITHELEKEGGLEAAEIVGAAVKEVTTIREDALKEIEAQIAEARKQVQEESGPLAIQIMEKILDRRISHETG
jgi:F-type H+-transporting ATPase subunit b